MMGDWIKCKDLLPELYQDVLICRYGDIEIASRSDFTSDGRICWITNSCSYLGDGDEDVHYWMPLPKPIY